MSSQMSTRGEAQIAFEQAAKDLEKAAAHLRRAAEHIENDEIPRTCAHVIATQGELAKVDEIIMAFTRLQAEHSEV